MNRTTVDCADAGRCSARGGAGSGATLCGTAGALMGVVAAPELCGVNGTDADSLFLISVGSAVAGSDFGASVASCMSSAGVVQYPARETTHFSLLLMALLQARVWAMDASWN